MSLDTPLDAFLPHPAHRTRFATDVAANPANTWAAMLAITPDELPLTRTLSGLRSAPARLSGGGRHGPADARNRPVVEQFVAAGFGVLHEDAPRVLMVGAAAQPWRLRGGARRRFETPEAFVAFDEPGFVRMALSFELTRRGEVGTRLATETRVIPTCPDAARAFARYWTLIRLGSDVIRLELLHGIRRRAEQLGEGSASPSVHQAAELG